MNIKCLEHHQKITLDQWDRDPDDMLMTVKCLPTLKYDLPVDDFPKVTQLEYSFSSEKMPISVMKKVPYYMFYLSLYYSL